MPKATIPIMMTPNINNANNMLFLSVINDLLDANPEGQDTWNPQTNIHSC